MVDFHEDDGEGFEPDVEKAVDECNVEIEKEDHGLHKVEGKRSDQGNHNNLASHKSFTFDLRFAL